MRPFLLRLGGGDEGAGVSACSGAGCTRELAADGCTTCGGAETGSGGLAENRCGPGALIPTRTSGFGWGRSLGSSGTAISSARRRASNSASWRKISSASPETVRGEMFDA